MDAKYCGECGEKLPSPNTKTCVKCGSDPCAHASYCMSCGEKSKSKNAVSCTKCGSALSPNPLGGPKDPTIAALLALGGMFLLGAPSIGYAYLGNVKKCLVYLAASWGLVFICVVLYFIGMLTYVGAVCCLPLFLLPLLLGIAIVYDVWQEAKGEKTLLPDFK